MNEYINEENRMRIEKLIRKGMSAEDIAEVYDMSIEEIKKIEASLLQTV